MTLMERAMKKVLALRASPRRIHVNSMELIRTVRHNDILYNKAHEHFNNIQHRNRAWDQVCLELFPEILKYTYPRIKRIQKCLEKRLLTMTPSVPSSAVQRRWQELHKAITHEARKNPTDPKRDSALMTELDFMIPHIRTENCEKLSDELVLRNTPLFTNTDEDDISIKTEFIDEEEEEITVPSIQHTTNFRRNLGGSCNTSSSGDCKNDENNYVEPKIIYEDDGDGDDVNVGDVVTVDPDTCNENYEDHIVINIISLNANRRKPNVIKTDIHLKQDQNWKRRIGTTSDPYAKDGYRQVISAKRICLKDLI